MRSARLWFLNGQVWPDRFWGGNLGLIILKEQDMKTLAIIVASFCVVGAAMAQNAPAPAAAGPADTAGATCHTSIGPKNLHGAALTSAATKCCKDAAAAAKLHGAAETSFTKKCVSDATAKS
jgi:hypothetical protein